jgi:hypothetical protein
VTSPLSAISLHHFHGAPTRVPIEDTAFGLRSAHLVAEVIALWEEGDPAATQHRAWAHNVGEALAPASLPGGYVNLLGPGNQQQVGDACGSNTARLLAIRPALIRTTSSPVPAFPVPRAHDEVTA